MRFITFLALLSIWLALPACAQSPAQPGFDTRALTAFGFDTSAARVLDSIARAHAPNEVGMCLHGEIAGGGSRLMVHEVRPGATHIADSAFVSYTCNMSDSTFVGVAHSHVLPTGVCIPSDQDFVVLIDDEAPKVLLAVIRCLRMTSQMPNAYAQLRDGRWAWLMWPTF